MDEVTAAQAATLTGLSERTIRRKIASGMLAARRLGPNRFAIKVADLPIRHPVEALALRLDVLEQRLARLEATLQSSAEGGQAGSSGTAARPFASAQVQQLFAQLAYETAWLARSLALPSASSGLAQAPALRPPSIQAPNLSPLTLRDTPFGSEAQRSGEAG